MMLFPEIAKILNFVHKEVEKAVNNIVPGSKGKVLISRINVITERYGVGDVDIRHGRCESVSVQEQRGLEDTEDTQKGKYLTFAIQDESYGIEIQYVTEIIGMQKITEVPDLPEFLRGIINLRGKIILVMDMRLRFRKPLIAYNDRTCIVVVDISEISVGLIVDTVAEVLVINDEDVVDPPETMMGTANRYIKAIGKVGSDVKLLLDCNKLLKEDEMNLLLEIK